MTRRGIIVAQSCVLLIMAFITVGTIAAVHLAAADWSLTITVAMGLVIVTLLTLVWSSLDLARDRVTTTRPARWTDRN